jgi:dihydropteroate synthase
LSVNSTNRQAAPDWGCEVVAVPDVPETMAGLDETLDYLTSSNVAWRVDPILEPIGFGFGRSLARYFDVRRRYPQARMLMGIGNLTELTDADSAAINVVLLGLCEELAITSVLTTQVIPWARTCVRECDLARRLVHYAVTRRSLPKHVEPRLVLLRGRQPLEYGDEQLARLAEAIRDRNIRIVAERGQVHVLSRGLHLQGEDAFALFAALTAARPGEIDPDHAYYLGYEVAKAVTALTLGKDYRQDQALQWGFLTRQEPSHHGANGSADGCDDSAP